MSVGGRALVFSWTNCVCLPDLSSTCSVERLSVLTIQRTTSESSAPFLLVLSIFRGFLLFNSKHIIQNILKCRAIDNR